MQESFFHCSSLLTSEQLVLCLLKLHQKHLINTQTSNFPEVVYTQEQMTKTEQLSHCIQFPISRNKHLVENERDFIMSSAHQTKHCSISIKHCYSALKKTTNKQTKKHPPPPKKKPNHQTTKKTSNYWIPKEKRKFCQLPNILWEAKW